MRDMLATGREVVVLDDLSTGRADRLPPDVPLIRSQVGDRDGVRRALGEHPITGVMHFAARKQVGESVARPLHYWSQNVGGLQVLLEEMVEAGLRRMVFSSSAAVYGQPQQAAGGSAAERITEQTPCQPINPYGATKRAGEWMVAGTAQAHRWRAMSLRYFNVAGAAAPPLGDPAALNLIPMVLEALQEGRRPRVFGDDYPTADGSCVRDYIHVTDLSAAHVAAARLVEFDREDDSLHAGDPTAGVTSHLGSKVPRVARRPEPPLEHHTAVNIGTGRGYSVFEVIEALRTSTGQEFAVDVVDRRPGDPPSLVADATLAGSLLGWRATLGLADIADSAWKAWQFRGTGRALPTSPD